MQTSTVVILACLIAVVAAAQYEHQPAVEVVQEAYNTPVLDRSPRTKRGLFLLKKKLLLGALGLKAVKVGAVGAGVAGALALKSKASHGHVSHGHKHPTSQIKIQSLDHHHFEPAHSHVEVHDWSG